MMKIGFIGCGNMASAMIGGMLKKGLYSKEEIIVSNLTEAGSRRSREKLGVVTTLDNKEVVKSAKIVFLAVKPQFYEEVLEEVKAEFTSEHILVGIAPGKTLTWLEEKCGQPMKTVRMMPNTPAQVGEGMTGVSVKQGELSGEEMDEIKKLFDACGKTEFIEERLMDAVVCASGSSPAFVYQFIEALADSAVRYGMPRKQAYVFAAQAVKGAAAMVLETGEHPAVLKDQVCSPAGTTIEGVAALEEYGLRNAVLKASEAVYNRCTKI